MADNRYSYNGHTNLQAVDLLFWVAVDETQKRLGFDDLTAASAALLGQADVPVPGKFANATKGTSVVSMAARKLLPFELKRRLPMIMTIGGCAHRVHEESRRVGRPDHSCSRRGVSSHGRGDDHVQHRAHVQRRRQTGR
nr:hypothetical protein [Burkholderia anthina]